jgi:hypothetical protein
MGISLTRQCLRWVPARIEIRYVEFCAIHRTNSPFGRRTPSYLFEGPLHPCQALAHLFELWVHIPRTSLRMNMAETGAASSRNSVIPSTINTAPTPRPPAVVG